MKRKLALLLALILCLSAFAGCATKDGDEPQGTAPAEETPQPAESDSKFTCTYEGGVLTFSGSGVLDYNVISALNDVVVTEDIAGFPIVVKNILSDYRHGFQLVLENGITEIGDNAFSGREVATVAIPETVVKIGESAFLGCKRLPTITIPDSVTEIGDRAFYNSSLKSITLPESVTKIGLEAFKRCAELEEVTILGSAEIGERAFDTCTELTSVTITGNVTVISPYAFGYCKSLTDIFLPETVTKIGDSAFTGCNSLTSVIIPEGVTEIGDYAFAYCDDLAEVTIPQSVVKIGKGAFTGCSLTTVTVPNPHAVIEEDAFDANVTVIR